MKRKHWFAVGTMMLALGIGFTVLASSGGAGPVEQPNQRNIDHFGSDAYTVPVCPADFDWSAGPGEEPDSTEPTCRIDADNVRVISCALPNPDRGCPSGDGSWAEE